MTGFISGMKRMDTFPWWYGWRRRNALHTCEQWKTLAQGHTITGQSEYKTYTLVWELWVAPCRRQCPLQIWESEYKKRLLKESLDPWQARWPKNHRGCWSTSQSRGVGSYPGVDSRSEKGYCHDSDRNQGGAGHEGWWRMYPESTKHSNLHYLEADEHWGISQRVSDGHKAIICHDERHKWHSERKIWTPWKWEKQAYKWYLTKFSHSCPITVGSTATDRDSGQFLTA